MIKKHLIKIVVIALVVASAAYFLGIVIINKNLESKNKLDDVEVFEYKGENLSTINALKENGIKGPQNININEYELKVGGLVDNPINFSYDELINDYQEYEKVVTLNCVVGWSAKLLWEGVLLEDILAKTNPKPGVKTVILKAYDGYSTSFPIEYILNNDIIMAYKINNTTLTPAQGFPFQLVAESKWGYKWIKWITEIELSDDVNYRGFREKQGYSNDGSLDKDFKD